MRRFILKASHISYISSMTQNSTIDLHAFIGNHHFNEGAIHIPTVNERCRLYADSQGT
jgi:hypothetical protein